MNSPIKHSLNPVSWMLASYCFSFSSHDILDLVENYVDFLDNDRSQYDKQRKANRQKYEFPYSN